MDVQVGRLSFVTSLAIAVAATASGAVDVSAWRHGRLHTPSNYVGGTATFKAAPTAGGTFAPVYKQDGTLLSVPAGSSRAIELPDSVMAGSYMKMIATVKQTTTAGAATCQVVLKG